MTKTTGFGISRRTLLAGATFGAAQLASPFVITARAAEAVKVGLLLPKSGPYAVQGEIGQHGAQVAIDDFGGHVLDRPIELIWLDESSPQTTQQNMRKLVEEEKVVAVQGGVSSGDVLAIRPWNEVYFGAVEKPGGGSPGHVRYSERTLGIGDEKMVLAGLRRQGSVNGPADDAFGCHLSLRASNPSLSTMPQPFAVRLVFLGSSKGSGCAVALMAPGANPNMPITAT